MKNVIYGLGLLCAFLASCAAPEGGQSNNEPAEASYFPEPADSAQVVSSEKLSFVVDTLITDLENPWGMAFLPNGDFLVTERPGRLRIVKKGVLQPEPIKGLPAIFANNQGGLFDLELHPNYQENGWLYVSFAEAYPDSTGNTVFIRARLQGDTLVDQEVLMRAEPMTRRGHHFGGRIEFDREGYLYLTTGDRGERDVNPQTLTNHNGKVHRLYDDGRVPEDNPFLSDKSAVPSIYSFGHRNLQGIAMHPETGEIYTHEHGPRGGDELNLIKAGVNYGWPVISYGINYDSTIFTNDTAMVGMEQPLHYWVPSIAPCGMTFVKNSEKYPEWKNNLLIGSLSFRYLARCELVDGKVVHEEKLLDTMGRMRAVEQGPDGYIYVAMEAPGMVLRLVPRAKPAGA